jgi:hypothetical protein
MPANEDLEGQLKIQQDINKVLANRAKMFDAQSDYLTGQVRLAKELCKALDCKELEGMEDRLAGIQKGFKGAAKEAEGLGDATEAAGKQAEKAEKSFAKLAAVAAGAAAGAVNGFRGAISTIQGLGSAAMRVAGSIFNIGKAVLSIPFKILNGLIGMATKAGGGAPVLRQAWEDVRETFGSLEKATGGGLYQGFKKMRTEAKNLGGTGISLRRIYGRGREGLAKAIKDTAEQFGHLEGSAHRYAAEIKNSMGTLAVWGKALYGTAEDMKALDHRSRISGKSMAETMTEFGNQTSQMRDKYHLDAKQFSKDMMAMSADAEHFGSMGSAELAALTVYTHKLGIEAKSLTSVIDKWDNFESAAEGASKLAQTFGMNVDAMEMMNEQNPAKRMDMLRNSFLESGRAVEDLTRAEKKLLAEQMGLADVADLEKAMADPTMNYDDILAEAEANEEASLTQEEALQSLADTIKREFGSGGGKQFSSFGDAMMQGFMKGMSRDKEFREMLRAVRCALYQVYHIGIALGKAFADLPLVEGLFKNITGFFKSFDFAGFKDALVGKDGKGGLFRALYDGLIDPDANPAEVVETFMEALRKAFEDAGSESGTALKAIKDSFIAIGKVIGKFFLGMLPYAMDGLAELVEKLALALEYMFSTDAEKDANAAFKDFGKNLDPGIKAAFKSIEKSWEDNLKPAFGRIFALVKPHLDTLAKWMLIYIIGKTVLGAVFGGMATWMGTVGVKMIKNAFTKPVTTGVKAAQGPAAKAIGKFGDKAATAMKGVGTKLAKAGKFAFKPSIAVIELGAKGLEKMGGKKLLDATMRIGTDGAKGFKAGFNKLDNEAFKAMKKSGRGFTKIAGKMGGKIARLGVKAIPIAGWAIAIADGALGMSRQMDLLEGKLGEKFESAAATAGAGAAGVVEFLTLGLLPQPALDAIGEFTATAVEAMGGLFDMLGLKGVYDMLVANMNLVFKVFAGIGDILVGLFTGDGDKVTKGFGQIFEGMWEFVKTIPGALVSLLIELPWTILKFLLTAVKFIFISLPLKIIGAVRGLLVNIGKAVYGFFTGFWKKGDKNTGTQIKKFWKGVWKSIKEGFFAGVDAVVTFFSDLWTDIKKEVKAALGISSPSSFFADIGTAIIDGLWSILTFLPKKFWQLATWAWEKFTSIFSGVGEWAAGFLSDIWCGIKALPGKMWQMAKDAWAKVTEIFDKAKDLGSDIIDGVMSGLGNVVGKITAPFKAGWKKIKGWFGGSPVDSPKGKGGLLGKDITAGMMKGFDGMADKIKQPFLEAWEFVKTIFSPAAFAQLFVGITSVILSAGEMLFNAILMPYKMALETLTQFFGPMLNKLFAGVVGTIMNIGEMVFTALTMPYKMALEFVTTVLNFSTFAKLGNQMIQGLLSTIGMLPEKIWEIGKAALGVLIKVFGFGPLKMIGSFLVSGLISGVSTLPDQMVDVFWNMMDTVKGMFDNVLETFGITGAVERIMDAFVQPHDVLETLTREYEFLNYGLEKLTAQVDDIARIITEDTVDRVLHTVDMISEIVENYNEINNLLSDIDPINLDANINKLGRNMSLSSETITIKNKPINITVNLHATMDAKGIATQLSKKGNAVQLAVASRNGTSVTNNIG